MHQLFWILIKNKIFIFKLNYFSYKFNYYSLKELFKNIYNLESFIYLSNKLWTHFKTYFSSCLLRKIKLLKRFIIRNRTQIKIGSFSFSRKVSEDSFLI
jgi:hypothetical protein